MMNFKSIKRYWNFDGYNRIKVVKSKQKTNQRSAKTNAKTYDDYLDKISGFTCCCKTEVCNCCCTYSLDGCCKKNTTQSYTTTTDHCICFTGMMEVRHDEATMGSPNWGYNDISGQEVEGPGSPGQLRPYGSLHPKNTCDGLTIRSITYSGVSTSTPNFHVTFSGDTWGGTFFKCIILTKDKTVIRLYSDQPGFTSSSSPNPQIWSTTNPYGGPFTSYLWRIPDNPVLTEGTWCVQISM